MEPLPHVLERTILIQASRETVFRYFTDSARWASWWGTGSTNGVTSSPRRVSATSTSPGGGSSSRCSPTSVDAWFEACNVSFRDRHARIDGLRELSEHIAAARRFMSGIRLERKRWAGGLSGATVFVVGFDGRIETATGLSNRAAGGSQ